MPETIELKGRMLVEGPERDRILFMVESLQLMAAAVKARPNELLAALSTLLSEATEIDATEEQIELMLKAFRHSVLFCLAARQNSNRKTEQADG